jgi:hypothetical protein
MPDLRWSTTLVPGLSALLGGVIGALVTLTLTRDKPTAEARPEQIDVVPAKSPNGAPLDGRVAALERSVQSLALRESMARAVAQPAGPEAGGAEKPPPADVAPIVDNPVFEAAVRDVMDRAEQERNLERETQRAEWRKRAAEEWGNDLSQKLRLTDIQKAKIIEIANGFWEKLRDARQGADAGAPPTREQRRQQLDALRQGAEAELAKVLDHSQLTSYQELDEASRLGTPRSVRASQRAGGRD